MDDTTISRRTAQTSADEAASDFRAALDRRREADDAVTLALAARHQAAAYADEIVRAANALARQIETEARARAEEIVAEAQVRATRTAADTEAARAALLGVIERTRADLAPTSAAAPEGVDLLFGAVEAAQPISLPSSAAPSSRPGRPAWPSA